MDANGNVVITWASRGQDGSGDGVFARLYQANGELKGDEFQVNTYAVNHQSSSDIAMDADGNFVITWQSFNQDGSGLGIFAQRYRADGTPLGSEFQVNTLTEGQQGIPAIAMDAEGDFVISWTNIASNGEYDIYARRFNADGTPVRAQSGNTTERRVNSFQTGRQEFSDIAMAPNGDFIITWQSLALSGGSTSGRDDSGYGVYAQRYRADATSIGTEFLVNTTTAESQYRPSVAVDPNGNFVIAWDSWNQDGSFGSIVAQYYHADGRPWGGEVLVNTLTQGTQTNPAVAMTGNQGVSNQDFIIAWDSADNVFPGQGNSTIDIYARRFDTSARPIVGTSSNDTLNGTNASDHIEGLGGRDTLRGRGGDDVLDGGEGNDTLEGDNGQDFLRGGAGRDRLTGGNGNDALFGDVEDVMPLGISSNSTSSNNSRNDYLRGGAGDDRMDGGQGHDTLHGGRGNDWLTDLDGNNRLTGGTGDDYLLTESRRDRLSGGAGHDRLDSGSGSDQLKGDAGNDVLIGSRPDLPGEQAVQSSAKEIDTLTGGRGADHFVLGYLTGHSYRDIGPSNAEKYARIRDFKIGDDLIHLGTGNYVLDDSPIHGWRGTGIFLVNRTQGATMRDLIGVVRGIQPDALDLSNSQQFSIGEALPVTSANWLDIAQ